MADAVVASLEVAIDPVVHGGANLETQRKSQAERDVIQTTNADGFIVELGAVPKSREGGKHQVHEPVDIGHVTSQDLDDGLRRQKKE